MWQTLRYYWTISKGYRLRPWASPYIRWRMETFFGPQASEAGAGEFCRLLWRERKRMRRFVRWAEERRRAQSLARRPSIPTAREGAGDASGAKTDWPGEGRG